MTTMKTLRRFAVLGVVAGLSFLILPVSPQPQTCFSLVGTAAASEQFEQPQKSPSSPSKGRTPLVAPRIGTERIERRATGELLAVRVVPEDSTLWGAGGSRQFLVLGKYTDGLERDVTSRSRFSISDNSVAQVNAAGRVMAVGEVVLTAFIEGRAASTTLRIADSEQELPFSFGRDIGGILTKQGCNSSSCHGGVKGEGGFKLSLNALYPRDDYKWILEGGTYQVLTAEPAGEKRPRIDLEHPNKSLLLLKSTDTVAHGGGERLSASSADYQTILDWVRTGAPYADKDEREGEVRVERLEVFPRQTVLDPGGEHQLLLTAHLSNGQSRDFTHKVHYLSNNPEVVEVTSKGRVKAVSAGETAVIIRAAGHATVAGFGVIGRPNPDYPDVPQSNFIDDCVFEKLRRFHIVPSELSSDAEFLRRVCLDLTGTLPPPERVREFLRSNDPRKRDKLIKALFDSPEYVDFWTFRFADFFRVARYANQIEAQHAFIYWEWIRSSIAKNKPYDQLAGERIAAQGHGGPTPHFFPYSEVRNPEQKMAEEVRVFMGRRLDCAQCHNHPFEAWSQDQFWGLAAFFGRLNAARFGKRDITLYGSVLYDDPDGQEVDYGVVGKSGKVIHPRTQQEVLPALLDGTVLPEADRADLRKKLAEWVCSHPWFAEAAVNRMWSYFFGRGIVDPVDDFRLANPPTHPDLLSALAKDFRDGGYDLKHLMRNIVSSRTYQLSSQPNETNREDRINYSHAMARSLEAEVLLDAISSVTGVPEVFSNETSTLPQGTRAIDVKEPDVYPSRFLEAYGRPNRHAVPERNGEPNLAQALHMLAGPTYTEKLSKEGGRVDRLLKSAASDREVIESLYLAALSRFPTHKERSTLETWLQQRSSRKEAFLSLLWGLISSREFSENH